MKKLILLFTLITTSLNAGLPPTTLSGQSAASSVTTFNFKTPYNQSTQISGVNSLIETGDEDMLINPGFEASTLNGWTCTTGTCTVESTVFSSGKQSMKVVSVGNAISVGQVITTPTNIQKQGVVGILYNAPVACSDLHIDSLVDVTVTGTAQTVVPTANLILDGAFHYIEIPVVFGATSAGIRMQAAACTTGTNTYFDAAVVKQGLGTQNLMLDNTYSAQVSSTGVISNLNKSGWISGNCAVSGTAIFDCPLAISLTSKLNCNITQNNSTNTASILGGYDFTNSTTSNAKFWTQNSNTGNAQAYPFGIVCQKSGADYLSASSNVYNQASANYGWTAYTPTFTGFGTVSTFNFRHRRIGDTLEIDGTFTIGTSTSTEQRISFPNSLISSSAISTLEYAGEMNTSSNLGSIFKLLVLKEASVGYMTFGAEASGTPGLVKLASGSTLPSSGSVMTVKASFPIAGWTNSNVIVGSFGGYANTGYTGSTDSIVATYGATATTACTTGTCAYLDNIGASLVTSVVWGSLGHYTINFAKTYSKLKCYAVLGAAGSGGIVAFADSPNGQCTSCNSLAMSTGDSGAYRNTNGTIFCTGIY